MATRTLGESPGVRMSWSEMWTWKAETPFSVPAGARISAGKSGKVDRSLPMSALDVVKRSPVSCMPSPESPANRTITWSSWAVCLLRSRCHALPHLVSRSRPARRDPPRAPVDTPRWSALTVRPNLFVRASILLPRRPGLRHRAARWADGPRSRSAPSPPVRPPARWPGPPPRAAACPSAVRASWNAGQRAFPGLRPCPRPCARSPGPR